MRSVIRRKLRAWWYCQLYKLMRRSYKHEIRNELHGKLGDSFVDYMAEVRSLAAVAGISRVEALREYHRFRDVGVTPEKVIAHFIEHPDAESLEPKPGDIVYWDHIERVNGS